LQELVETIKSVMKRIGVRAELVDALDPALPLVGQGVDSIDYPLTVIGVEHHFRIKLDEKELLGIVTLLDFAALIRRKRASIPAN
jgi:acyl carrier protein